MTKRDFDIFKRIPTLKTERLILRKIEKTDLDDVYEYASDPAVPKYLMWYEHKAKEYTKQYLKFISKLYARKKFYDWAITYNGKMIGTVGFSSINLKHNRAEIGYVLNRNYWGKGIAAEAVAKILEFGFLALNFNRIEAIFLPENAQSRRVLEKSNMKSEGIRRAALLVKEEYRDVEIYSILKEEYLTGINNQLK